MPADGDLTIRAVVLLNPIDRERLDAIKEWVAQNSRRSSLDPAGAMGVGIERHLQSNLRAVCERIRPGVRLAADAYDQALPSRQLAPVNHVRVGWLLFVALLVMAAMPLLAACYLMEDSLRTSLRRGFNADVQEGMQVITALDVRARCGACTNASSMS